jgi:uncharacterized protein (DUF1330 family)
VSAYLIFNYDITDPAGYQDYPVAAFPSIKAHGAEVVVADYDAQPTEGSPGKVTVVLRFDSKDAATAWYESEEYAAAKPMRLASSQGIAVLCDGFAMPG